MPASSSCLPKDTLLSVTEVDQQSDVLKYAFTRPSTILGTACSGLASFAAVLQCGARSRPVRPEHHHG